MTSHSCHRRALAIGWIASTALLSPVSAKTLIDYFKPVPIVGTLSKTAWGAAQVGARDQDNGLEDKTSKSYSYWDGKILQAADGTYHMFASRWQQSLGHWSGWPTSLAVHATSSALLGPYTDKGVAYTDNSSKGHNVTAFQYNDGTYGMVISQTRPASVYNATSLNGPWTLKGVIAHDYDHTKSLEPGANTIILPEKDGSFLEVGRHGYLFRSVNKVVTNMKVVNYTSAYPDETGVPNMEATQPYAEDPVLWYSGGRYHMVVNWCDSRVALHLMSDNGTTNWKNMGLAYDPRVAFIKHTDGTVNKWNKLERPGIVMGKDGHVEAFTFAAMDVDKGQELGNDLHNSKIIVVPFDGAAFDKDFGLPTAGIDLQAKATAAKLAIQSRAGSFAVDYQGLGAGEAEFQAFSTDGSLVARRSVNIAGRSGSFPWNELAALPRGVYLVKARARNGLPEAGSFLKP